MCFRYMPDPKDAGNLIYPMCETMWPFADDRSLGLAVPVILVYTFSLALQTYVLRLDVIVAMIGLVFVGFEGLLSIGTALSFYHAFRG